MSAAFDSDEEEGQDGTPEKAKKRRESRRSDVKRPYMVSIFVYAMKQSYVLALIAMMVILIFHMVNFMINHRGIKSLFYFSSINL